MHTRFQNLSVMDISEICGVARSTVSYWIAKKSLQANRSGNRYLVSVDDLVFFLKSEHKRLPQALHELAGGGINPQQFKPLKRCWEYWASHSYGNRCQNCCVFEYQINECFTVRENRNLQCRIECHECQYFCEYYGPRVAFIHQIDKPAAIYKNLYFWSGNYAWAELCGVKVENLIGAGIEELFHPDSLKIIISYDKRRIQGDPAVPDRFSVFLNHKVEGKIEVYLSVSPLIRPAGTWLTVAEDLRAGKTSNSS